MAESNYGKLVDYIKKNITRGYTSESLKWALIKQGYSRSAVEKAIEQTHKDLAEKAPVLKEKPIIKHILLDENDNLVMIKKPWWKRIFGI